LTINIGHKSQLLREFASSAFITRPKIGKFRQILKSRGGSLKSVCTIHLRDGHLQTGTTQIAG